MMEFTGFETRIPLPENPDAAIMQAETRPQWLPRQAGHTGLKFTNGLEMSHNAASKAAKAYDCPVAAVFEADGVQIKTDGSFSEKAIRTILTAKSSPYRATGQPLKFSNGTAVSHSDESRACADFANKVDKGRIIVKGLKAEFTGPNGQKVRGIQATRAKLSRLFKSAT